MADKPDEPQASAEGSSATTAHRTDGPIGPEPIRAGRWSNPAVQAVAAIIVIAAVAIGGLTILNRGDMSSGAEPSDSVSSVNETTTTVPVSTYCKMELAGWLDFALSPGGSLAAAATEFGAGSPEYVAIETAWSKFAENTYVVGADQATTVAVESLAADCDTIGDSYIPGHNAPN